MTAVGLTPPQTIGPFFHYALPLGDGGQLVAPADPEAVKVGGTIRDGGGHLVTDAMIEIWQANRHGRYAHPEDDRADVELEPGFSGFGRVEVDEDGSYEFVTVKPGVVPTGDGAQQAPHIALTLHARGVLRHLITRLYFPDETEANAADPALRAIGDADLALRLVAEPLDDGLRFDIHLQGERETPFLAF